jgi:hypothetical protein
MTDAEELSFVSAYIWVALGVALSVLIPTLVRAVGVAFPSTSNGPLNLLANRTNATSVSQFARPYLLLAAMSLTVGLLIVAFAHFTDGRAALIGGYAWDSTLQKIRRGVAG